MQRRGLSNIIVTVLIVLISIVLIGILWVFFSPFLLQLDETTNVADCYTPQFAITSCEYSVAFTSLTDGQAYKPVLLTVKRNEGVGDIRGLAFQAAEGDKSVMVKDPAITIKEFESVHKIILFPNTPGITPTSINVFSLVGEKRKLCRGPPAATLSCVCHQVTNQQNRDPDINCDGTLDGFDVESYTRFLFNPHQNEFVTCAPNAGIVCPSPGDDYSAICPDIDGDGVVREFDIAEVEAGVGGGTAGCQT